MFIYMMSFRVYYKTIGVIKSEVQWSVCAKLMGGGATVDARISRCNRFLVGCIIFKQMIINNADGEKMLDLLFE